LRESYEPRGAVAELFTVFCKLREMDEVELSEAEVPELIMDGPAGTGKSFGFGHLLHLACRLYPGCRILVFRKTRVSLNESFLETFEEKIIRRSYPSYTQILRGPRRINRQYYIYPNGSKIVLGGMDQRTRLFSTEYDIAYCNECTEISEEEWQSVHRALRNYVIPFQMLLGDCNPGPRHHWILKRMQDGKALRLKSEHADNPFLTDSSKGQRYLKRLRKELRGADYERLYLGEWVTSEGVIYRDWDEDKHIIKGQLKKEGDSWVLHPKKFQTMKRPVKMEWCFASQDFGVDNPGCLQVWGVDRDERMYLLEEVYMSGKNANWWAKRAAEMHTKYELYQIVCDYADASAISIFNDYIVEKDQGRIAIGANKDVITGINQVLSRLEPNAETGVPDVMLFDGARSHDADPKLLERNAPTCTAEEFPAYVWETPKTEETARKDVPKKKDDHGMDALRYACMWAWQRDYTFEPADDYAVGTWGHKLGLTRTKFGGIPA